MDEIRLPRWFLNLVAGSYLYRRLSKGKGEIKLVFYEPSTKKPGGLLRAVTFSVYLLASVKACTMLIPFIQ